MTAATMTPEQAQDAWDLLAEKLRVLNALATGCMHWSERFDEADLPPGPSLQEAAIDLAAGEADDVRRALLIQGGSS